MNSEGILKVIEPYDRKYRLIAPARLIRNKLILLLKSRVICIPYFIIILFTEHYNAFDL